MGHEANQTADARWALPSRSGGPRAAGGQGTILFLFFFVLGAAGASFQGFPNGVPSLDAIVRAGVGNDLFAGLPRGRQGLVGSLRWAPLPTLATLPFLKVPGVGDDPVRAPFAACLAAAAAYALLAAFINSWWAGRGLAAPLRLALLATFFVSPPVMTNVARGSSDGWLLLCGVAACCFLAEWWRTEELRPLAYLSCVVGLGMVTRYQFALVFVVVLAAVFLHLLRCGRGRRYAEATMIVVAAPAVYLGLLWLAANWLIMGDALFFLRGLPGPDAHGWSSLVAEGCAWGAFALPLALAAMGRLIARVQRRSRAAAGLASVMLAAGMLLAFPDAKPAPASPASDLVAVTGDLESMDPAAGIVISGFRGYEFAYLAGPRLRRRLVHKVSLYLDEVMADTRGQRLYLLVPPPDGGNRWEDVHIKFPALFNGGADFALFERQVAGWRLWRLVRLDDTSLAQANRSRLAGAPTLARRTAVAAFP